MYQDYPQYQRPRGLSVSSDWSSSDETKVDQHTTHNPQNLDTHRRESNASERSCEGMSMNETRDLWRCMLELQEKYGCYNSRRIDLAMDAGEDGVELMPNRFIIDTLNDSLFDLPQEGWQMLDRCLHHHESLKRKAR